jgi:hypothetical protein
MGRRRLLLGRLLLVLGGTVTALLLGEIAVRICAAVTHRDQLVVGDERTGWALRPNLRDHIRAGGGGQYVMSTDAEGHRITRQFDERPSPSQPWVILLGDSYIQATAADDSETFAWILARDLPANVVNLAVLGFGTDQELLTLESFLYSHPDLDVRDVIVFVTENDFIDVQITYGYLGRTKPRFQVREGRLDRGVFRRTLSDRLMDVSSLYWLANSKIAEYTGKAPDDPGPGIDVVVACLAAMHQAAERRGARFHVLAHHLIKIHPLSLNQWADFRRRTGAVDITDRLHPSGSASPIGYDRFHWNSVGHQRVAAIVKEQLGVPPAHRTAEP